METLKTARRFSAWKKNKNITLGFIPTLGALHAGHFSLIKKSKQTCSLTVVSIFLNPKQFSVNEDLDSYPDTLNKDIKRLKQLKVDVLFLPTNDEMYKNVDSVVIPETDLFNKLEGKSRPHFFSGVTTIVAKLFNVIQPSHAFFGEKDAQQLCIIKQMIVAMKYPVILISCPTIRNKKGLALSSRNSYLTIEEQKVAASIYQNLMLIKIGLNEGKKILDLKETFYHNIEQISNMTIDYLSFAYLDNLQELSSFVANQPILISTAIFYSKVRLIDNFIYNPST